MNSLMDQKKIAIYPGTFDPVTNGHLDIMVRANTLFDKLIVAVALSPKKNPLFSTTERVGFINEALNNQDKIEVHSFDNLLIDFAFEHNASVIIKGLRAVSDFEFELQMGLMNRNLNDQIETVFMIPSQEYSFLSSSFIKETAQHGADIRHLVPKCVYDGLQIIRK
jgi:pantetheine-phosphate adenylyltransferase